MEYSKLPIDADGVSFAKAEFWLEPDEYRKIYAEINQVYEVQYKGKSICVHPSFGIDGVAYLYWFENHGFNNYNIYLRVVNNN